MDPLFHTRDEGTVKMDFTGWTSSEEGEDRKIGRKGDGHSFLECTRYNSYRLPSVETNAITIQLIGPLIGFNNILKKKRPYLVKKKVLFHQDNARVYTCPAPMIKFRYELLPPVYSPDLVPCDYFLFPNLKKWFGRKKFTTREQLIAEIETYFEGLDKLYCIIRTVWKSWRIVGSSVSSWKETMLKNKNESIKKNVFYYVFLKTYWFALVLYNEILIAKKIQVNVTCNCYCNYKERGDIMYHVLCLRENPLFL